jgi:BioD-like phosphotransacetylase family protein
LALAIKDECRIVLAKSHLNAEVLCADIVRGGEAAAAAKKMRC